MKRLYFLVPNLKVIRDITHELENTGITHRHIHALGQDSSKLDDIHVHSAGVLQTTELVSTLKKGIIFGLVLVVGIFIALFWFLPEEMKITTLGALAVFVFGFGFGIWSSGMIGLSIKDQVVEKNEDYVKSGHYIMIIDVPKSREAELTSKVVRHHPGTRVASEAITVQ
tara:strand:+ start:32690 stop:33196 length:507 start_codon:yes stop_codon:yes gene_type:complete